MYFRTVEREEQDHETQNPDSEQWFHEKDSINKVEVLLREV